jgi:hypothetical protein
MSHYLLITAEATLGAGNKAVNTFHYSADGAGKVFGPDQDSIVIQANHAIDQLKSFYQVLTVAFVRGDWTIGSVVTEHQTGQPVKYVAATPQTETGASGVAVPEQLAGCISWRTGLAGRSHRGRSYMGPLTQDALTADRMNSGWAGAVNSAAATLISAPSSSDLVLCVYSEVLDQTTAITQGTTTDLVRTMRSRAT